MQHPKIIHQIWMQGIDQIPVNLIGNMNKIKKMHLDWTYILWDEIMILQLLRSNNPEWLKQYYKFSYLHQKVDYAKLIILYLHGGICIDMDAYTKKKLDGLFIKYAQYDFVISNIKHPDIITNYIACHKTTSCFNNGNFFGKPHSDILKYLINNITDHCSIFDHKILCIHKTTGPLFFNKIIDKYMNSNVKNKSKIFILDAEYLEPCMLNICNITDNTVVVHEHTTTWIDGYIREFALFHIKYAPITYSVIIFIVLCIIYYFFHRVK